LDESHQQAGVTPRPRTTIYNDQSDGIAQRTHSGPANLPYSKSSNRTTNQKSDASKDYFAGLAEAGKLDGELCTSASAPRSLLHGKISLRPKLRWLLEDWSTAGLARRHGESPTNCRRLSAALGGGISRILASAHFQFEFPIFICVADFEQQPARIPRSLPEYHEDVQQTRIHARSRPMKNLSNLRTILLALRLHGSFEARLTRDGATRMTWSRLLTRIMQAHATTR